MMETNERMIRLSPATPLPWGAGRSADRRSPLARTPPGWCVRCGDSLTQCAVHSDVGARFVGRVWVR